MNIAYIGQKGIPATYGGIERHVEELSTRIAKLNHQVFVYCREHYVRKHPSIGTGPLPNQYRKTKLIFTPSILTSLTERVGFDTITHSLSSTLHALGQEYDILHYHGIGPTFFSIIPRFLHPKLKIVATFHSKDYEHQKWGSLARLLLKIGEWATVRIPHGVITVSRSYQSFVKEKYRCETTYIPNGVPAHTPTAADDIYQWNLSKDGYILAVARLVRHKGLHYLIDAYMRLKTDKKLVIVGGSAFTDHYAMALKIAAKANPNIIFTGYQTGQTLTELFSNACLFVHPSMAEGLPIVVLEAMSYARCPLVSNISENLEAIGETGFAFEAGNTNDLVRKLESLLNAPELVEETGRKARLRVRAEYNWDDITQKTEEFYQGLFDHHPKDVRPAKIETKHWDQVAHDHAELYASLLD